MDKKTCELGIEAQRCPLIAWGNVGEDSISPGWVCRRGDPGAPKLEAGTQTPCKEAK